MDLNNKDDIDVANKSVTADKEVSLQMKKPKKVLHFSDGTLEEFSEDEDEIDGSIAMDDGSSLNLDQNNVDEKNLSWGPWLKLKSFQTGNKTLSGIDYVGGILADFLGITTSKFALEYEQYKKNEEEKAEIEKEKLENLSWQEAKNVGPNEVITTELKNNTQSRF